MCYKTILLNHFYLEIEKLRFKSFRRNLTNYEILRYTHIMKQIKILNKKSSVVNITDYDDVFEPSISSSAISSNSCCAIL